MDWSTLQHKTLVKMTMGLDTDLLWGLKRITTKVRGNTKQGIGGSEGKGERADDLNSDAEVILYVELINALHF